MEMLISFVHHKQSVATASPKGEEDEWNDFAAEQEADYSGLRIQKLNIREDAVEDDEEVGKTRQNWGCSCSVRATKHGQQLRVLGEVCSQDLQLVLSQIFIVRTNVERMTFIGSFDFRPGLIKVCGDGGKNLKGLKKEI